MVPEDAPEAPRAPILPEGEGVAPKSPESLDNPNTEWGRSPTDIPVDPDPHEDIERILPGPGEPFELVSGRKVIANPLKLRGFLAMLRIITRGATMLLGELRMDRGDSEFIKTLINMLLFSIPESPDEVADFLRVMVRPAELPDDDKSPGKDAEGNALPSPRTQAILDLDAEFDDPELDDMVTIIEVVIRNEGSDLRRLGKRLQSALEFAQKTNALNQPTPAL